MQNDVENNNNIGDNSIGDEGAKALVTGLEKNNSIMTLFLRNIWRQNDDAVCFEINHKKVIKI